MEKPSPGSGLCSAGSSRLSLGWWTFKRRVSGTSWLGRPEKGQKKPRLLGGVG
ncbi:MAG: hypothetical protein JRD68_04650 [Deltaproteobacteria bacterium]|nr:hypothetical protein [Deltaproteobacteria bacterium]